MTKVTDVYQIIFLKLFLHCTGVIALEANITVGLTVPEIASKRGYPIETFENVTTEDGYLLTLFRIRSRKNQTNNGSDQKPVLLMHGMGGSSRDYIIMGPERGLGYLLTDRGYDVWLGNARGTLYSRKHLILNADDSAKYWDFSWHEIGVYDLPAMIDLIKNVTAHNQISYIGMSQGTTVFYVLASERSEYNADISLMVSLSPVAFMGDMLSPLPLALSKYGDIIYMLLKLLNVTQIPPRPMAHLLGLVATTFCTEQSIFIEICSNIFQLMGGYNPAQLNKTTIPSIFGEGPSPISSKQLLHYAQNINSGKFRQFNYGKEKNFKKYRSRDPPSYNLSKITVPVSLFYSSGDWLAQPADVKKLCDGLTNCFYKYKVPLRRFNHFDFLFAKDVVPLVYEKVFLLLDEYN